VRFRALRRGEVRRLYLGAGLYARETARKGEVSHSTVLANLNRNGIEIRGADLPDRRNGQVPFGWELREYRLVNDAIKKEIIRTISQYVSTAKSLRVIAKELNPNLDPTKNNGIWQANTMRRILKRVETESGQCRREVARSRRRVLSDVGDDFFKIVRVRFDQETLTSATAKAASLPRRER